jgi:hypothetical protein
MFGYFTDLRASSSFLESEDGFFLSLCSCYFHRLCQAKMTKLFIYIAAGFCLTFEHEVLPDMRPHFEKGPGSKQEEPSRSNAVLASSVGPLISNPSKHLSRRQYDWVGVTYIVYELVQELLSLQDPVLEFCSRSVYYYKARLKGRQRFVSFEPTHHHKVRSIETCLVLLQKQSREVQKALGALCDSLRKPPPWRGPRSLLQLVMRGTTRPDALAYYQSLLDSSSFFVNCVENGLLEARIVHTDMEALYSLNQGRTTVFLSMVR